MSKKTETGVRVKCPLPAWLHPHLHFVSLFQVLIGWTPSEVVVPASSLQSGAERTEREEQLGGDGDALCTNLCMEERQALETGRCHRCHLGEPGQEKREKQMQVLVWELSRESFVLHAGGK